MNDDLEAGRIISHCVLGPQDLINYDHESMMPINGVEEVT